MNYRERKRLETKCEHVWREIVRLPCECARCGKKAPKQWFDAAHVFTRSIPSMQFEPDNGVCLCRKCHRQWQHEEGNEAAFIEWFKGKYPLRYQHLLTLKQTIRKLYLPEVLESLCRIYYERLSFLT